MAKRITYKGSVTLFTNRKDRNGQPLKSLISECIRHPKTGKPGVFIPIEDNPSIYLSERNGGRTINLDIEAVETPNNQYGNSHLLKLSIGKENRQKLGTLTNEQYDQYTPIVGNLKRFEFEDRQGQQEGQQGYQGPDMPANIAGGGAPQEFDGSW